MANCINCGKDISEGIKFCPSCGTAVQGAAAVQVAPTVASPAAAPTAAQHTDATTDAEQNKGMAILAYILFFIPLLTGDHKKSPFVRFHTNQGTVLFIAYFGGAVALSIISTVLFGLFGALLFRTGGSGIILAFAGILWPVFIVVVLVLWILGIINAAKGNMKPLPIIGRFEIIK